MPDIKIENAILWISNPSFLFLRAGGITVLERHLHTAKRAGLRRVWITAHEPRAASMPEMSLPKDLEIIWIGYSKTPENQEGIPDSLPASSHKECPPPYLVISGTHLIRIPILEQILKHPADQNLSFLDRDKNCVAQIVPERRQRETTKRSYLPLGEDACWPLKHPISNARTLNWLLAAGPKAQDGFMARYFDRHISMFLSRHLLESPITPNMMTVLSCAMGIAATAFFLPHQREAHLTGALLLWLHSVLDGCDGELARVRFQETPFGGNLDFWGDNLVHVSLFGCLALGFARADESLIPLAAGALAIIGIVGSALMVFLQKRARRQHPTLPIDPPSQKNPMIRASLSRLEAILEQRDFIYLLVILAYFEKTYEFLWAGAVGSILFFIMMIHLGRTNHEKTFQPNSAG